MSDDLILPPLDSFGELQRLMRQVFHVTTPERWHRAAELILLLRQVPEVAMGTSLTGVPLAPEWIGSHTFTAQDRLRTSVERALLSRMEIDGSPVITWAGGCAAAQVESDGTITGLYQWAIGEVFECYGTRLYGIAIIKAMLAGLSDLQGLQRPLTDLGQVAQIERLLRSHPGLSEEQRRTVIRMYHGASLGPAERGHKYAIGVSGAEALAGIRQRYLPAGVELANWPADARVNWTAGRFDLFFAELIVSSQVSRSRPRPEDGFDVVREPTFLGELIIAH